MWEKRKKRQYFDYIFSCAGLHFQHSQIWMKLSWLSPSLSCFDLANDQEIFELKYYNDYLDYLWGEQHYIKSMVLFYVMINAWVRNRAEPLSSPIMYYTLTLIIVTRIKFKVSIQINVSATATAELMWTIIQVYFAVADAPTLFPSLPSQQSTMII